MIFKALLISVFALSTAFASEVSKVVPVNKCYRLTNALPKDSVLAFPQQICVKNVLLNGKAAMLDGTIVTVTGVAHEIQTLNSTPVNGMPEFNAITVRLEKFEGTIAGTPVVATLDAEVFLTNEDEPKLLQVVFAALVNEKETGYWAHAGIFVEE